MRILFVLAVSVFFYSGFLYAEANTGDVDLTKMLSDILIDYAAQYPWVMLGLLVMAKARAIFKPLFWLLHKITDFTETTSDNALLNSVEKSKILAGLYWLADFLISAKIVDPKKQILREYKNLKGK